MRPCALDESSPNIERVKAWVYYGLLGNEKSGSEVISKSWTSVLGIARSNAVFKQIIEYVHLNIIPTPLHMDAMPFLYVALMLGNMGDIFY